MVQNFSTKTTDTYTSFANLHFSHITWKAIKHAALQYWYVASFEVPVKVTNQTKNKKVVMERSLTNASSNYVFMMWHCANSFC